MPAQPNRNTLPGRFGHRGKWWSGTALAVASATALSLGLVNTAAAKSAPQARSGGILTLVGQGDVDFMDTVAGYYSVTYTLERAITRQLYTYPSVANVAGQVKPVPDLATQMPVISNGGKTYTIMIRTGARWNTKPARQVTAADEVLGMKRLCNPASPTGAPGYFENTIVGMKAYCDGFAKVAPDPVVMKQYIKSHNIAGVKAVGKLTVQFQLIQPASDFINILALPFSSPAPAEYLNYVPSSPALAQHFISDGPYRIVSYDPTRSIVLTRNPAWKASTDPIRHAYVSQIKVTQGVPTATSAVQLVQAGSYDMLWDQVVPTALLAGMVASHDSNLVIGPNGDNYITINPIVWMNEQSPNNRGALGKLAVRQAIEYAMNKVAASQVYGGSAVSNPLNQVVPRGSVGYVANYNPYPTAGNAGDPAKAKAMLAQAGYSPGEITLKLVYRTNSVHPQIAQTDQAALQAAGFNVTLIPVTPANTFYTAYLENPTASQAGSWDIAEAGWIPDWLGNNGRAVIEPLFDGRTYGTNTQDYGAYNNATVNADIDKALAARSTAAATKFWQAAARQVMADAAVVPLGAQKTAVYHSSRVHNCIFNFFTQNCDITNLWLK